MMQSEEKEIQAGSPIRDVEESTRRVLAATFGNLAEARELFPKGVGHISVKAKVSLPSPVDMEVTIKGQENLLQSHLQKNAGQQVVTTEQGIDVSHYNNVDWSNLDSSISFAIIKATDGATFKDPNYDVNITAARQQVKKVGSFHFFRPDDTAAAQFQQIQRVVDVRPDDFPLAIDVENADDTGRRLTPGDLPVLAQLVSMVLNQYQTMPMIYTNTSSWSALGNPATSSDGAVNFGQCPLWIADPNDPSSPQYPQPWILWSIWQYATSAVGGVSGNIERNVFNGSFSGMLRLRVGNGAGASRRRPKRRAERGSTRERTILSDTE
jgi:GH25 family lysozyme M1 (1,4-beta-N-acetylmuramidase)